MTHYFVRILLKRSNRNIKSPKLRRWPPPRQAAPRATPTSPISDTETWNAAARSDRSRERSPSRTSSPCPGGTIRWSWWRTQPPPPTQAQRKNEGVTAQIQSLVRATSDLVPSVWFMIYVTNRASICLYIYQSLSKSICCNLVSDFCFSLLSGWELSKNLDLLWLLYLRYSGYCLHLLPAQRQTISETKTYSSTNLIWNV